MSIRKDIDWYYLTHDSRAQVYLVWALICNLGFTGTHLYQQQIVNPFWAIVTLIGLAYMWRVMPMKVTKTKRIFAAWAVTLGFGMLISGLVFRVAYLSQLLPYLGVFWMLVMGFGFVWNGLVDKPMKWYLFAGAIHVVAAVFTVGATGVLFYQYLIAGIVSVWAMLYLWLLRT